MKRAFQMEIWNTGTHHFDIFYIGSLVHDVGFDEDSPTSSKSSEPESAKERDGPIKLSTSEEDFEEATVPEPPRYTKLVIGIINISL